MKTKRRIRRQKGTKHKSADEDFTAGNMKDCLKEFDVGFAAAVERQRRTVEMLYRFRESKFLLYPGPIDNNFPQIQAFTDCLRAAKESTGMIFCAPNRTRSEVENELSRENLKRRDRKIRSCHTMDLDMAQVLGYSDISFASRSADGRVSFAPLRTERDASRFWCLWSTMQAKIGGRFQDFEIVHLGVTGIEACIFLLNRRGLVPHRIILDLRACGI